MHDDQVSTRWEIRDLVPPDVEAVVEFGLRAWEPVAISFERLLGPHIYEQIYPDWLAGQAQAIKAVCLDPKMHVSVAALGERLVGFVAVVLNDSMSSGEIDMVAVDPNYQRQGVGSALTSVAVDYIRSAGMTIATVATGGDPGHAPARRTYEKAGFVPLPLVRYYKAL